MITLKIIRTIVFGVTLPPLEVAQKLDLFNDLQSLSHFSCHQISQ